MVSGNPLTGFPPMAPKKQPRLYRNYLHFLGHTLRLRFDRLHRVPLTVHIALTARCPHRCLYCNYENVVRSDRLTAENLEEVFDDAYRLGTRRVNFTGGEPVLHPDFNRIIASAVGRGFLVTASTSGWKAEEHLEAFKSCNTVMLSLEGPPEVHGRLCGEESARAVTRAVEAFSRNGVKFWTTTLLTKLNIDRIDWVIEHARRHQSVANFSLLEATDEMGPDFHPTTERIAELLPSEEECRAALARLIELKKKGAPVGSTLPYLEELLRWPDYRSLWSPEPSRLYRCLAGKAACEISFDGTLYNCGWEIGRTSPLSVLELGFAEAFRRLPPVRGCRSCTSNCWLESNLIFNLNPRAIRNWVTRL